MSNKAELLKKIKALADRGVDGERESAQTLLTRLMEQYGISETEIEEERREALKSFRRKKKPTMRKWD